MPTSHGDASPVPTKGAARGCVICGGSLEGRRSHARTCGGSHRADRSRLLRILDGETVDGASSVHELYDRREKIP